MAIASASLMLASCGGGGNKQEKKDPFAHIPKEDRLYSNAYDGYTIVRKGPGVKHDSIGCLKNGEQYCLRQISTAGKWITVEYEGGVGYVYNKLVSNEPSKEVTINVHVNWLKGIWYDGNFCQYLIFDNGKYACVFDVGQAWWYGTYILEGDEIVLTSHFVDATIAEVEPQVERFKIDMRAHKLGECTRVYMPKKYSNSELEELAGELAFDQTDYNNIKKVTNRYVKM